MKKNVRSCTLGLLMFAAVPNEASACTNSAVVGTSYVDGMALCKRYDSAHSGNWVYVAVCSLDGTPTVEWVDVCDTDGILTDDVVIQGGGGGDVIKTIDYSGSTYIGGSGTCPVTCWGEVDLGGYEVDLEGEADVDLISTSNSALGVVMYGGGGNDQLEGNDASVTVFGEAGADHIIGSPGEFDILYGGIEDDCIEDNVALLIDCGPGNDTRVPIIVYEGGTGELVELATTSCNPASSCP